MITYNPPKQELVKLRYIDPGQPFLYDNALYIRHEGTRAMRFDKSATVATGFSTLDVMVQPVTIDWEASIIEVNL